MKRSSRDGERDLYKVNIRGRGSQAGDVRGVTTQVSNLGISIKDYQGKRSDQDLSD